MATYAQSTSVDSAKSRAEIERTLERYDADQFAYASMNGKSMIEFVMNDRRIRFIMDLPDRNSKEFTHTETGKARGNPDTVKAAYEQAVRQKWRALALVVKAKLEAVESGIAEFEQEFAGNIVLSDGTMLYDRVKPGIAENYRTGAPINLLQLGS